MFDGCLNERRADLPGLSQPGNFLRDNAGPQRAIAGNSRVQSLAIVGQKDTLGGGCDRR